MPAKLQMDDLFISQNILFNYKGHLVPAALLMPCSRKGKILTKPANMFYIYLQQKDSFTN